MANKGVEESPEDPTQGHHGLPEGRTVSVLF
jgi:hypothetical protein